MSRAIRIELTPRNLALLLGGLVTLIVAVLSLSKVIGHASDPSRTEAREAHAETKGDEHEEGHHDAHEEGRIKLSPGALKNAGLEVLTAGRGEVNVTLSLPGEVSLNADTVAHVTPRVGGTAREVKKQVGDVVTKGEVLATLDSRELAEAQRDFLATKERLALAQATFERAEMLQKEKISAEKDYLAAKQALAEAKI